MTPKPSISPTRPPLAATQGRRPPRRLAWLAGPGLALLTLAAHAPAIPGQFLWDDNIFIWDNPVLAAGEAPWGYWTTARMPDYLPVTWTFFHVQRQLWGDRGGDESTLPYPALPYRAVNVALHAAAVVLLWRVLAALAVPGAWLGALLFAVHPMTVASTGWVAETKNTLSLVFCALALLAYLRFDATGRWRLYAAAVAVFALALLTKTSTMVLPAVLAALLWWRRGPAKLAQGRPKSGRRAATLAGLALLSVAASLVTMWVHQHVTIGAARAGLGAPEGAVQRLATAANALWFYAAKALVPVNLMMLYPKWDPAELDWTALAAPALLAWPAVLIFCRRQAWARPAALATACFAAALAPVLGLVDMSFMQFSFVSDHLAYLALPAAAATAGAATAALMRRGRRWRAAAPAAAAALVVLLSAMTAGRAHTFASPQRLWADTVQRNPRAWYGQYLLGWTLLKGQYGDSDSRLNAYRQAVDRFSASLALQPAYPDGRTSLGAAYGYLGAEHAERGEHEQALACYAEALRHWPDGADVRCLLGSSLLELGRPAEALEQWQRAMVAARAEGRPEKAAEIQSLIEYHGRGRTDEVPRQRRP